jgi:hypothetical protein
MELKTAEAKHSQENIDFLYKEFHRKRMDGGQETNDEKKS